jgi:hypothetical protein
MPTQLTATRLRAELFKTLDQVVTTGEAVEVQRPGGKVCIVPATESGSGGRLARLRRHPGTIVGDVDSLSSLSWDEAWKPTI